MLLPLLASSLALALCQEEEHFLDVKQIVKGTIEAMQRLPDAALQTNTSTQKPEDIYSLFRLPADIMTKLAVNAGYLDEPTTTSSPYGPWIVARPKGGKEESEEDSSEWEEVRRKKKRKNRPEDNGLVSLKDLLKPLPGVQQPLPQPQLPSALPPASSFMAQADPVRTSQDPLYRREVTSDGQVRFVPVYSFPTKPSSIVVATPRPVQQSNQQFEAPTFPPQINPFQPRVLPPRIVLPQPPVLVMPVPVSVQQLPMADPVVPSVTTPIPESMSSRKPPLVVQPVMRPETDALKPKTAVTTTTAESSQQVVESASMEDDAVIHSEESVSTENAKKSTVTKTALRVRTIEHAKPVEQEEEDVKEKEAVHKPKKLSSKKRAKTMKVEEEEATTTTIEPPMAERPTKKFEKEMENIEEVPVSKKRRVHASKTLQMGRKGNKELLETEERVSEELEQLSGESDVETTTMMTTKKRRKHHFRKMTPTTTEATTTEATTSTTETPTTTEGTTEGRKERKGRKRNGKHGKKRTRKNKLPKRVTTTTANPISVTPQHCSNIRAFARQFGVLDLEKFARSHCEYVENYYAELTCDTVDEYVQQCKLMQNEDWRRT